MQILTAARAGALIAPLLLALQYADLARSAPPQTVTFTGSVTHATTNAPITGAQVFVRAWTAGAVTDSAGVYTFSVPGAMYGDTATVEVQLIGYGAASKQVRIEADTVRTDFQLSPRVLEMEGMVIRGAVEQAGRREVGNSIAVISGARRDGIMLRGVNARTPDARRVDPDWNTENYAPIEENEFHAAKYNPLSTFSIDVDRASYANVRRFLLHERTMPPKDAVRVEELVNYFTYDDPAPKGNQPFAVRTELGPAPWRPAHRLLRIGLKAKDIPRIDAPPGNFVFLIDVSGSMRPPNKLPLLKQAFALLVNEMRPADRIAIVVYASSTGLVLESTPGDRKETVLAAIEQLEAGGSTAGGAGLRLAYDVVQRNRIEGGNNRVILATDGDFNVGESSDAAMMRLIEEKREQGAFLTVLGFGAGNIKDSKMELLADKGNGNYSYIDGIAEARKVLVEELGGTLLTVAKDVKIQVEFNPARVAGYRLIGYENRLLAAEDFNDDRKDAGELGAGHSVTALYEIVPVGVETDVVIRTPDSLRYQAPAPVATDGNGGELAFVKLRYKEPDGETSRLLTHPVAAKDTRLSEDFTFSAAVAAFGMVLRDSPHRGGLTLDAVLALARDGLGEDAGGYRQGFIDMVEAARKLTVEAAGGPR